MSRDQNGGAPAAQEGAQGRQLLTFNVGEQLFGVEIDVIKEIIQYGAVTRVPMVPVEGNTSISPIPSRIWLRN